MPTGPASGGIEECLFDILCFSFSGEFQRRPQFLVRGLRGRGVAPAVYFGQVELLECRSILAVLLDGFPKPACFLLFVP